MSGKPRASSSSMDLATAPLSCRGQKASAYSRMARKERVKFIIRARINGGNMNKCCEKWVDQTLTILYNRLNNETQMSGYKPEHCPECGSSLKPQEWCECEHRPERCSTCPFCGKKVKPQFCTCETPDITIPFERNCQKCGKEVWLTNKKLSKICDEMVKFCTCEEPPSTDDIMRLGQKACDDILNKICPLCHIPIKPQPKIEKIEKLPMPLASSKGNTQWLEEWLISHTHKINEIIDSYNG